MIETYTDKATTWAQKQQDVSGNTVKKVDVSGNTVKKVDVSGNSTQNTDVSGNTVKKVDVSGNKPTDASGNTEQSLFYKIFNKSNIILIIWFLAIYFIVYFILGFFMNAGSDTSNFQLRLSNTLDLLILGILLIFLISYYYSSTDEQKSNLLTDMYKKFTDYVDDPNSIFSTGLFIFVFYVVVYLFRFPMTAETKPIFISIVETIVWVLLVIICFVDFFKYVLGIDVMNSFKATSIWKSIPTKPIDISLNKIVDLSGAKPIEEVFNVSNNLYTYDDAQAICTSYGAKLATYDQIEQSYNKGAEWCNYGWSDGQMIFFPTQRSTWNNLQKDEKHKNDCGRPGVNGGYIANPYMKFGVNCYGKKPKPTQADLNRMSAKQNQVTPKTEEQKALDAKVGYWKENADKLLQLNSYNTKKWSQN